MPEFVGSALNLPEETRPTDCILVHRRIEGSQSLGLQRDGTNAVTPGSRHRILKTELNVELGYVPHLL